MGAPAPSPLRGLPLGPWGVPRSPLGSLRHLPPPGSGPGSRGRARDLRPPRLGGARACGPLRAPVRGPGGPSPGPCPLAGSGAFAVCSALSAPPGARPAGRSPCGLRLRLRRTARRLRRSLPRGFARLASPVARGRLPPRLPGLRAGASLGRRQVPSPSGPVAARSGPGRACPSVWGSPCALVGLPGGRPPPAPGSPFPALFRGPAPPFWGGAPSAAPGLRPGSPPPGAALAPPAGGPCPPAAGFFRPRPPACVASGAYQGRDFKAARKGTPFSLQRSVSSWLITLSHRN